MSNVAFLSACSHYEDGNLHPLHGVEHDVQIMRQALIDYCGCDEADVYSLTSDDSDNGKLYGSSLLLFLDNHRYKYEQEKIENLFFYYSGHGYIDGTEIKIIPSDGLFTLNHGMLPLPQIIRTLQQYSMAEHIILILDVCQNVIPYKGTRKKRKGFPGAEIIFYSCLPYQESYMLPESEGQGSLFTNCFVDVLKNSTSNYSVEQVSEKLKDRLEHYCSKLGIEQEPRTSLFDAALGEVQLVYKKGIQIGEDGVLARPTIRSFEHPADLDKSIWLKDAEQAVGEQTRFETFTKTELVNEFIQPDSKYWGIASVKGIGKTFLLQVKRIKMSKTALCFPDVEIPSKENNWATESVKFSNPEILFEKKARFQDFVLLWKYSLVSYILHCWIMKQKKSSDSHGDKNVISTIIQWIESEHNKGNLDDLTLSILLDSSYATLQIIMQEVLLHVRWKDLLTKEYVRIQRVAHNVLDFIAGSSKENLVLFLDKLDQAIRQPNSESALSCEKCSKRNSVENCTNQNRGTSYCYNDYDKKNFCSQRENCCYGCELFFDSYAGTHIRTKEHTDIKNSHYNYWQWLQLALVCAVSDIQGDYSGRIKVIYTIRLEAFNCSDNILGSQRSKIMNLTQTLYYTQKEQEKIFKECIAHQQPGLLCSPSLASKKDNEDLAFVGVDRICHPYVHNKAESVFDIIYRHSFDRTRDIQDFGQALTEHITEIKHASTDAERGAIVKEIIEETAARLAYNTNKANRSSENSYYFEKIPNMPSFWADTANFESLLGLIDRNLLFSDDMRTICRTINHKSNCPNSCKMCLHHPFSVLKNLGMLGYILLANNRSRTAKQQFLSSADVTYFHDVDQIQLNDHTMYMIHPALTKSIEKLRNDKIMHFCGFLIGKDILVEQKVLRDILADKQELKKEDFENKYYRVFRD